MGSRNRRTQLYLLRRNRWQQETTKKKKKYIDRKRDIRSRHVASSVQKIRVGIDNLMLAHHRKCLNCPSSTSRKRRKEKFIFAFTSNRREKAMSVF